MLFLQHITKATNQLTVYAQILKKIIIMQPEIKPAPVRRLPLPEVPSVRRCTGSPPRPRVARHFRRPLTSPPLVPRFPELPAMRCPWWRGFTWWHVFIVNKELSSTIQYYIHVVE